MTPHVTCDIRKVGLRMAVCPATITVFASLVMYGQHMQRTIVN